MNEDVVVKEKLAIIAELDKQIEGIKKTRDDLIRDANKPVYEAKAKAEQILSDAQFQEKYILDEANKIKKEADEYSIKTKQSIDGILIQANIQKQKADDLSMQIIRDKVDFDASKIAVLNDISNKKSEIQMRSVEISEQEKYLNGAEINSGIKKAELDRRETAIVSDQQKITQAQNDLQIRKGILDGQEAEIIKEKSEVVAIRERIKTDQNKLDTTWMAVSKETEKNQILFDNIKVKSEENDKKVKDIAEGNKAIVSAQAKLSEELKTIEEKKRMLILLNRQVDEKTDNLKKLRAQETK